MFQLYAEDDNYKIPIAHFKHVEDADMETKKPDAQQHLTLTSRAAEI